MLCVKAEGSVNVANGRLVADRTGGEFGKSGKVGPDYGFFAPR